MTSATETQDDGQSPSPEVEKSRLLPHLFLVLECDRPTRPGARYCLDGVGQVILGRGPERLARRILKDGVVTLSIELPGRALSRQHARLVCARGQWFLEDLGSKNGTFVDGEQIERCALPAGGLFDVGHTIFALAPGLATPLTEVELDEEQLAATPAGLATLLPGLQHQAVALLRLARTTLPILLLGETGTGKELVARALHEQSGRRGRFIAVHCGSFAPSILEERFWGHRPESASPQEKGENGLLRAAGGGTLFLDELGDLPLAAQTALLHVLDTCEKTPEEARARLITATHLHLEREVNEGRFRADLYARLAGYTHTLAPLRERQVDLGILLAHVLRHVPRASCTVGFDIKAGRALLRHPWPLNARELRQTIDAALVLSVDGQVQLSHLPAIFAQQKEADAPQDEDEQLRESLIAALRSSRGNVAEVARTFQKGPTQIHRWMKRFGLNPGTFRSDA